MGSSNEGLTKTRKPTQCSVCETVGHNARSCPRKVRMEGEVPLPPIKKPKIMPKKMDALRRADYEDEVNGEAPDVQDASSEGSDSSSDDEIENGVLPELWEVDSDKEEDTTAVRPPGAPGPGFQPFQTLPEGIGLAVDWSNVDEEDMETAFSSFFTTDMIQKFVTATNNFAVVTRIKDWKPMPVDEFNAFLGIVLYLGIVSYPTRDHVWDSSFKGSRFVRSIMSQVRFEQILHAWHYKDYSQLSAEELKVVKAEDPFWAVREFTEELADKCQRVYNPALMLDIDEQTIPWKGRHKCRCYNPKKPEKWHFKVFALNDSITGDNIETS